MTTPAGEQLYSTAKRLLGENLAPGNERLGCAISMSAIHNKAFPKEPPLRFVNTTQWYEWMKGSDKWVELAEPEPDCVIVSVTGQIPTGSPLKNGHIGIVGRKPSKDGTNYILSNNSFLGYWDTWFTLDAWRKYYQSYGKIPTYYFKRA